MSVPLETRALQFTQTAAVTIGGTANSRTRPNKRRGKRGGGERGSKTASKSKSKRVEPSAEVGENLSAIKIRIALETSSCAPLLSSVSLSLSLSLSLTFFAPLVFLRSTIADHPWRGAKGADTRAVGVPFRDLRRFNRTINLTPCCNNTSYRAYLSTIPGEKNSSRPLREGWKKDRRESERGTGGRIERRGEGPGLGPLSARSIVAESLAEKEHRAALKGSNWPERSERRV